MSVGVYFVFNAKSCFLFSANIRYLLVSTSNRKTERKKLLKPRKSLLNSLKWFPSYPRHSPFLTLIHTHSYSCNFWTTNYYLRCVRTIDHDSVFYTSHSDAPVFVSFSLTFEDKFRFFSFASHIHFDLRFISSPFFLPALSMCCYFFYESSIYLYWQMLFVWVNE